MAKMTKREALQKCYDVWDWLAKNAPKGKESVPDEYGLNGMHNSCPCCEYVKQKTGQTQLYGNDIEWGDTFAPCKEHCPLIGLWPEGCMRGAYDKWDCYPVERAVHARAIADACKEILDKEDPMKPVKKPVAAKRYPKVGDRVEILMDRANGADVKKGDIWAVESLVDKCGWIVAGGWYLLPKDYAIVPNPIAIPKHSAKKKRSEFASGLELKEMSGWQDVVPKKKAKAQKMRSIDGAFYGKRTWLYVVDKEGDKHFINGQRLYRLAKAIVRRFEE